MKTLDHFLFRVYLATMEIKSTCAYVAGIICGLVLVVFALFGLFACAPPADALPYHWREVLATQFGHRGDKWAGTVFACDLKPMNPARFCVAHRTIPCGSILEITKGDRTVFAPICDRGPYWASRASCMARHGKYAYRCWREGRPIVKAVLRGSWQHMNELDLMPRVGRALRLGGMGIVRYRIHRLKRRRK